MFIKTERVRRATAGMSGDGTTVNRSTPVRVTLDT
jgi:hypothetical protein